MFADPNLGVDSKSLIIPSAEEKSLWSRLGLYYSKVLGKT